MLNNANGELPVEGRAKCSTIHWSSTEMPLLQKPGGRENSTVERKIPHITPVNKPTKNSAESDESQTKVEETKVANKAVQDTSPADKDGWICSECRLTFPNEKLNVCDGCTETACDHCIKDYIWSYCPCFQWRILLPPPRLPGPSTSGYT